MSGTISKAQACLLLLPLIYVCLQALKWPTSEQWEVNVHRQNSKKPDPVYTACWKLPAEKEEGASDGGN